MDDDYFGPDHNYYPSPSCCGFKIISKHIVGDRTMNQSYVEPPWDEGDWDDYIPKFN